MPSFAGESTRSQIQTGEGALLQREIPALTVAAHPDASRVGERVALPGLISGRSLALSRLAPDFAPVDSGTVPAEGRARPLADPWISRRPLTLEPTGAVPEAEGVRIRLDGSATTVRVDGEELAENGAAELSAERLRGGVSLLLARRVVLVLHFVRFLPPPRVPRFGLVGESDAVIALRREIQRLAPLEVPVLVRGATGTGKELVATALHRAGGRREGPFLALNMAAVPISLAASELFGAAKGAYTGATEAQPGHFRRSHGGTLFLDEIGEVPEEVQVLLLRALETGEVQPVGGGRPVPTDVRLVAATDADLEGAVVSGRFRAPLLHRLAGYTLRLPELARRREDIGRLFLHFLRRELAELGAEARLPADAGAKRPWLPAELMDRLVCAQWPGNVRELKNSARRLAIAHHDEERASWATLEGLVEERAPAAPSANSAVVPKAEAPARRKPSEISDDELRTALRHHRFNLRAVAEAFGISRTTLYAHIEARGVMRKAADLERGEIEAALAAAAGDVSEAALHLEVGIQALKRRIAGLELP